MESLSALFELATAYQTCRDVDSLTKTLSTQLSKHVGASAVLVWLGTGDGDGFVCRSRWFAPGTRFDPVTRPVSRGVLAEVGGSTRARRLGAGEFDPKALSHLVEHDRERVKSAVYAPIPGAKGAAGVLEILNHPSGKFSAEETALVEEAGRMTGRVLENVRALEEERNDTLSTIERLTSLYDISRIFNSTLDMDDLLPIVTDRIQNILGAQGCNLWLVDSKTNELYVAKKSGEDPTTEEGERTGTGKGPVGEVAMKGEPRVVENAEKDEGLAERATEDGKFRIRSWMCSPLMKEENVLGAVEVFNRSDGHPFGADDLFFLKSIAEQATIALHNANLLEAERKVHELGALLAISKEITSTLNLDHILTTVVHQAATVLDFERCAIGLWDRNKFILAAVSGEAEVPRTQEMDQLRGMLAWVANQKDVVSADQYDEGWQVKPEDGKEVLVPYLTEHEHNGFYALPLRDDQGAVGVLALMSGDAEFLTESQRGLVSILAGQTTVAIRNARLYSEMPMMRILQPLAERKQKLQAMRGGRWLEIGWRVALVVLALVVVPWKMRVAANATVVPAERRTVSAEVSGVVQRVLVKEGDKVAAGTLLAELDDSQSRVKLSAAQANWESARHEQAQAEDRHDLAGSSQARLRAERYGAEAELYRQLVEKARLRAAISGVVVTPKVEEKAGRLLAQGEAFCELVEQGQIGVEMNVPETQLALVRNDAEVVLKLNSYPLEGFQGRVSRVGAQSIAAEGEQFFVVRALMPNPGEKARSGMVGRAKITATGGWGHSGWYPIGYVLLRDPARWVVQKVWQWLP